ncbi:MAG: ATP-binding cassette domain-containing protein [Alphaproteobacteria bacterium]|nr:ATP-binding cassette domain-containing protein [Alphaproteobacteria bacterium]
MDAILVDNLTKTYKGGVKALQGVSFSVKQGEIFGLLGPNGAGKSTTVRILATLTQADGGRATVAGHDVMTDAGGVRRSIGYVAQATGVDRYATGRENLTLQAQMLRVPRGDVRARVSEMLDWVNLTERADKMVNTYSGGMKRRLEIAMGLVHQPSVLFLDEPTTGLDPETRRALWRDLERLRAERNISVLLTTHYLEEADALCDRLSIVDHGRVVAEGTPEALKAEIAGDTVTLDVGEAVARAAEILGGVAGVLEVIPDGSVVTVRVRDGASAVPAVAAALNQAQIEIRTLRLGSASLDDVYLKHTGHHYDADAKAPGGGA